MNDRRLANEMRVMSRPHVGREVGFTLVELMIALVLGLLVIAGVGSVFLANKDAYRTNEALSQTQDAARTAFEFLARDIREAGSTPCGSEGIQSTLEGSDECGGTNDLPDWVDDFDVPISGTDDTSTISGLPGSGEAGAPVSGSNAIRIGKAEDLGIRLADPSDQPANDPSNPQAPANFKLAEPTDLIESDDVLLLCDAGKASIFQVSSYVDSTWTVRHNTGNGSGSIGNCTKGLNHPIENTTNGNGTTFLDTSYLAVPRSTYWYVGTNSAGSRSLFRARGAKKIDDPGDWTTAIEVDEMVRGVETMTIQYHESGNDGFSDASAVSNWDDVDAVWLQLTIRSRGTSASDPDIGAGSDRQRLQRTFSTTVAIRNRLED